MLVTKQLTVAFRIYFHTMKFNGYVNCLVFKILQNILLFAQQSKETYTFYKNLTRLLIYGWNIPLQFFLNRFDIFLQNQVT